MVDHDKLEEYKKTVQDIIDKYLPEDKNFSVQDFNEEQLYYACILLTEKDDEKRKMIRGEIKEKLNHAKYEYKKMYYEIIKNKELFDNYNNFSNDLDNLTNDIEAENEMDFILNKI